MLELYDIFCKTILNLILFYNKPCKALYYIHFSNPTHFNQVNRFLLKLAYTNQKNHQWKEEMEEKVGNALLQAQAALHLIKHCIQGSISLTWFITAHPFKPQMSKTSKSKRWYSKWSHQYISE